MSETTPITEDKPPQTGAGVRLSVIIPAYNEAERLPVFLDSVITWCGEHEPSFEVIVVDDGSEDDSVGQLQDLDVILLRNPRNMGKGYSLHRGLQHALSLDVQAVITLDGDAQHNPDEISRLLQKAVSHPHRIIIAARLKQRENAPRLRLFANKFADFWVSWAAGYPVVDSQSGFRLFQNLEELHVGSAP